MAETGPKRNRSSNFSATEIDCMVEEILKRAAIIENKKTDAITWRMKDEAWNEVVSSFNMLTGGTRTVKMLKTKYDGLKRGLKIKNAKIKAEKFKTGGGPPVNTHFLEWEERLMGFISLSVKGLPTENDCDADEPENDEEPVQEINDAVIICGNPSVDPVPGTSGCIKRKRSPDENEVPASTKENNKWDSWNPTSLRTPLSRKLRGNNKPIQGRYQEMSTAREELIEIQKEVASAELKKIEIGVKQMEEEHVEQLKNIKLKQENLLLKQQLYKRKLNMLRDHENID